MQQKLSQIDADYKSIMGSNVTGNQDTSENQSGSLIIVADDTRVNLEAIKLDLESIGQIKRAEFYVNGQEVVDRVKEYVGEMLILGCSDLTACPI